MQKTIIGALAVLLAAGVPSVRYTVAGAGHGDKAFRTKASMDTVIGFLDRYCR